MGQSPKDSKKKAAFSKKLFAQITNAQPGMTDSRMEAMLKNIDSDLACTDSFRRNNAANLLMKIYTHLVPKESAPLVQINNNTQINNKVDGNIVVDLKDFLSGRAKKIEAIEQREDNRKLEIIKSNEPIKKKDGKLPANSPINPS